VTLEEEEQRERVLSSGAGLAASQREGKGERREAVLGCLPVRGLCGPAGLVGRAGREVRQAGAIGLERG